MAGNEKHKITQRFNGIKRGEAFDWPMHLDRLDINGEILGPHDMTAPAELTVELWTTRAFTEVGPPAAVLLWSKTFGSGVLRNAAGGDPLTGDPFLEIRDGDYGSQVAGVQYFMQGWFDQNGDDIQRETIFAGIWCWSERGVATP